VDWAADRRRRSSNGVTRPFAASAQTFPTARLFCTCWLIYAVHWAPFMIREQFPAITLATAGTLNVDRFAGWTEDIFRVGDGRAFINNNPGASIVAAIPLLAARPILDAIEHWNDALPASYARAANASRFQARAAVRARREWYIMAVAFVTAAGVMATTSSLVVTALGRTLWASGLPRGLALATSLSLGFATPIFVRTSYLNHNLLVGHAGLLAALILWNRGRPQLSARRAAAAGSLCGFAVLCDYSGVLVLGAAGIYAWLRSGDEGGGGRARVRSALFYAAGAAPMLLTLALYQRWAFGNPALPSQQFMPAIAETARGYRGMSWPSLEILTMNFFDARFGLFAVCPLLALSLAAPLVPPSRFRLPERERWLALFFFAAFTVFCASNQYSRLQWTTGFRYLVPVVPGLLLLSLEVLQRFPAGVQWLLMTFSLLFAWLPAANSVPALELIRDPTEFQMSWLRRMAEYGAVSAPGTLTAVVMGLAAVAVGVIWWPRTDRGDASAETAPAK
jgi:hypothetical protein